MTPALLFAGRLERMPADVRARLLERGTEADAKLVRETADILNRVRLEGDAALLDFGRTFDGVTLESIEVDSEASRQARDALDAKVRAALEDAADAIARFHRAQLPRPVTVQTWPGVTIRREAQPLARVGVYAPGGRAAYPSSVLMGAVPARIAGVSEVIVCSPPGPDGVPGAGVLAACAIAGVDRVFAIGGAGAVGAMARGTVTVPRVDRIVGPGNAWVAEAKRQVNGLVGIDCPAGPSEILIIADETADADIIAAELIAQAEHDPDAAAVLVTIEASHVEAVQGVLEARLADHPRRAIVAASLERNGALLVARDLDAAARFASDYAAEHLLVLTRDPDATAARTRNAGTIFLGPSSSVVFGDYVTGANHVLPTGGAARAFAGLSIHDFLRWITVQDVSAAGASLLAERAGRLADAEGFPGHAAAARMRAGEGEIDAGGRAPVPLRFRDDYAGLRTYDPGRVPCEIDLSDNTNLWGPNPAVQAALSSLDASVITRYPAVYADRLRSALASGLGVEASYIATGCGSDDVIDSTLRAFAGPGDDIAYPWPTFGMVPSFARMNGVRPVAVPLRQDLEIDVAALLDTRAPVTYICRPNNPTGTLFRREDVETVIENAAGLVIIDEAYVDFSGDDVAEAAIRSGRAVVLRTLSKVYGLAGLRVGFAIGPEPVIAEIEKSRGPYKVNALAEAAALAALDAGRDAVQETVAWTLDNRRNLVATLEAAGHVVLPSAANFVLVRVPDDRRALDVATALRTRGVAVRPFADLSLPVGSIRSTRNQPQTPAPATPSDWIRVTIGPSPMMQRFLDAYREVVTS